MFKRVIPFILVVALLVPLFSLSVSAATYSDTIIDYSDFITNIKVDGDNDLVTVSIPADYGSVAMWEKPYAQGEWRYLQQVPGGTLQRILPGGEGVNVYRFFFYQFAYGNYFDLTDIPDDTVFSVTYTVSVGSTGYFIYPDYEIFTNFYNSSFALVDSKIESKFGITAFNNPQTISWTLNKSNGARYLTSYVRMTDFQLDDTNVNVSINMDSIVMQFSISSLYRLQQSTGKTNKILSSVEKKLESQGKTLDDILDQQQQTNDKLDDIVDMPLDPTPPPGADNITDFGDQEDALLNDTAAGRDEFNRVLGSSFASLEFYRSSFAFLTQCVTPIYNIPWIREILVISLGMGIVGFLLNIGLTAISKNVGSSGRSSKKGG